MSTVREAMSENPITLDQNATVLEAARQMKERDVGDVLVSDGSQVCGILTDRDIVVRCLAEGQDPASLTAGQICSRELTSLSPDADVEEAIRLMTEHSVRRIPVVEGQRPVGILSLGDLAIQRDRRSVLGQISAAPPNS